MLLYSVLQENPVPKLVSDPWFCAAVNSRVDLCAHFIHQFSARLAALGVLASCAVQRAWRRGQGRECKGGVKGFSKSAMGLPLR